MPQMQGNALEISLDFQFGPIPAIFSEHAAGVLQGLSSASRPTVGRLATAARVR